MTSQHHRLSILGHSLTGWTAAVYAARANLSPVSLREKTRRQLTTTTDVITGQVMWKDTTSTMERNARHRTFPY